MIMQDFDDPLDLLDDDGDSKKVAVITKAVAVLHFWCLDLR